MILITKNKLKAILVNVIYHFKSNTVLSDSDQHLIRFVLLVFIYTSGRLTATYNLCQK